MIADMLLDFFIGTGINRQDIFCSSLPGNDVNEKISVEVKVAMKNSKVNIAILSQDYYQSAYCLNEAGIMWYLEDTPTILIALPEIDSNHMYGFLNSEYKLRSMDNDTDIAYIYDKVCRAVAATQSQMSVVTYETHKLKERYQKHLESRINSTCVEPIFDILPQITTDDERIVLYYILKNNVRKVSKNAILEWLRKNEIYHVNIDNAFDLLSTIDSGAVSNDILELNADVFRKYSAQASAMIAKLEPYLKQHIDLSSEKFQKLWNENALDEHIQLFVSYIIEERVISFGSRWMAEVQIKSIKQWECKNSLDSKLSDNYGRCLEYFIQNHLAYQSSWTSYGNPREYTLFPSLQDLFYNHGEQFHEDLQKVKGDHYIDLPF